MTHYSSEKNRTFTPIDQWGTKELKTYFKPLVAKTNLRMTQNYKKNIELFHKALKIR